MKDKIIKLKNGGVLIYSKNKLNNTSAVEVGFSVGAFSDKKPGVAHFLEHTLFKKTKNRTNFEVDRDRNKITFLNASTGLDFLVLKFTRTNKLIKEALEFSYDVLMNSVIDDEFLESEKGVIKEELKMCLDEESRDIYLLNYKQAITNPKFSSDIVGCTEKNIDDITFNDICEFKNRFFIGNNFVVSVSSSLSCKKIKRMIDKIFTKNIPYIDNPTKKSCYFQSTNVDKKSSLQVVTRQQEKSSVLLTFKLNKNEQDIFGKDYNYTFLARFLSGSQGDLFLRLRNQGLIYKMSCDISTFKNTSLFNIEFETSKEKIKQTLDLIKDEIKKVTTELIDMNFIMEYRKNAEYFIDEKLPQRPSSKSHTNLSDYLTINKLFIVSDKQRKLLRNGVEPEKVRNVAREIFSKNNDMFVTVFGNAEEKDVPEIDYFLKNFLIAE